MGVLHPTITTLTVDTAHPSYRGLYIGINRTFCDFGILVGPILAGLLSDMYGLSLPFVVIAAVCLVTSFVGMLLRKGS